MLGLARPFLRTARPFVGGDYFRGSSANSSYISHPQYAHEPVRFVRAFLLLQSDLLRLFEYNEPADQNSGCYSFRAHEILLRASIEVEANCKAILGENGYKKAGRKARDWTMDDYKKIELSHRLSGFQVRVPNWHGNLNIRAPFASWGVAPSVSPQWYKAYNATKHDRHLNFEEANLANAVDAVCGVLVMLAAQFANHDFDPTSSPWGRGDEGSGFWPATGSFFTVRFPDDWPEDQRYGFSGQEWDALKAQADPFARFSYP
jgi:hypothetical protein